MSDWQDYEAKRTEAIAKRFQDESGARGDGLQSTPSDSHRKAGCYGCTELWNGENARKDAEEHQKRTGHDGVWFIDSVR